MRGLGVYFNNIDIVSLRKQYFAKAAEEGFKFDLEWQAAIGESCPCVRLEVRIKNRVFVKGLLLHYDCNETRFGFA